tara:strand:+ start:9593 stop:10309 length:717 start_codon:yes stop_codon:yes gene_type:complete
LIKTLVILNGGFGTRLGKITQKIPKCLVDIRGKTFLERQLDYYNKSKLENVFILTGHFSEIIEKTTKKIKSKYDFKIFIIKDKVPKLGTGASILNFALNYKRDFFFTYGDSYLDIDLKLLSRKFYLNKNSTMTIYKNFNKYDKSNINISGRLINTYKKNSNFKYIDYGITALKYRDLLKFKKNFSYHKKKFNLSEIFNFLIYNNKLSYYITSNRFYHIGDINSLDEFIGFINNNTNHK